MSPLYSALRAAFQLLLDVYFVEVRAVGLDKIPKEGPLLFAANHPNSVMDAIVLSVKTNRHVSFLGRAGLLEHPVLGPFFAQLGVIPIYRRQDDETQMGRNADSFARAYEVLAAGRAIGIFPEGTNSEEHRVGEFRTGVARIAFGAEEARDWSLGLKVVPVGLSYEDRDAFMSAALIRFGDPIDVATFRDGHADDPLTAVAELTAEVAEAIAREALHISDRRLNELTAQLWQVADAHLLTRYLPTDGVSIQAPWRALVDQLRSTVERRPDVDGEFEAKRALADALERIRSDRPREWIMLRLATQRHLDHVGQVSLRQDIADRDPETTSRLRERLKLTAYAIAFGPLAFWGFVANVIPYQTVKRLALLREEAMRAVTVVGLGLTLGPMLFIAQMFALWRATGMPGWIVVFVASTALPSGFFFMRYRRQVMKYRQRILARTLFRRQRSLLDSLFDERAELIATLESLLNADEAAESGKSSADPARTIGT